MPNDTHNTKRRLIKHCRHSLNACRNIWSLVKVGDPKGDGQADERDSKRPEFKSSVKHNMNFLIGVLETNITDR